MKMEKRFKLLLSSAKKRGILVKLNTKYYADLIGMGCLYCGEELINKTGTCLDRQDSSGGYTNDNVVGCCHICNYAKRTLKDHEFYDWVTRAYDHQLKCKTAAMLNSFKNNLKEDAVNRKNINVYFNTSRVKNAITLEYKPT